MVRTEGGETRIMTFQVAEVSKQLASAGRITAKEHRIVFDDEGAYIMHKTAKGRIKLHKEGHVFVMKTQIMPPGEDSTTQATKDNGRLLGELGFTQQEDD